MTPATALIDPKQRGMQRDDLHLPRVVITGEDVVIDGKRLHGDLGIACDADFTIRPTWDGFTRLTLTIWTSETVVDGVHGTWRGTITHDYSGWHE